MRRLLLGGLGLAALSAGPALGQSPAPGRAATLGRPVAVVEPAAAPESGVTPVGLFNRSPLGGQPVPVPQQMPGPLGSTLADPRPMSGPSVTELRGGAPVPSVQPAAPATTAAPPAFAPPAFAAPPAGVPVAVGDCPDPAAVGVPYYPSVPLESPLYGGVIPGDVFANPEPGGGRWWVGGEYLMWWTKRAESPVLLTTAAGVGPNANPANFLVQGNRTGLGFVGEPGTVNVFDGDRFGQTLHGGARVSAGWWFSDDRVWGIDSRFFYLGRNGAAFNANSQAYPVLTRPFVQLNAPAVTLGELVGFPNALAGAVQISQQTSLWGLEVNLRRSLGCRPCGRLDLLLGYRGLTLKDELTVGEVVQATTPVGATLGDVARLVSDQFRTSNTFNGGQVGLAGETRFGRWFVDGRASVAFGNVNQRAEIAGGTISRSAAGVLTPQAGGLLALPGANIGTYSQNKFAVLPEAGFNFGYYITPRLRVYAGYNFLYLSSVVRPGEVIDPGLDVTRIPGFTLPTPVAPLGVPRPAPILRTTDFWVQGINFGIGFNW